MKLFMYGNNMLNDQIFRSERDLRYRWGLGVSTHQIDVQGNGRCCGFDTAPLFLFHLLHQSLSKDTDQMEPLWRKDMKKLYKV